jgi:hypothetical protein
VLEHLAGKKGNVAICLKAPQDIKEKMGKILENRISQKVLTSKRNSDAAEEMGNIVSYAPHPEMKRILLKTNTHYHPKKQLSSSIDQKPFLSTMMQQKLMHRPLVPLALRHLNSRSS